MVRRGLGSGRELQAGGRGWWVLAVVIGGWPCELVCFRRGESGRWLFLSFPFLFHFLFFGVSFCGQKVGGKAGTQRRRLGARSSVRNFWESLGSAASALTAGKTAAHIDPRGDLCHLVMSQGWKTLPFFSREIHGCPLAGRGAGSPPAFEAQARCRGHRCPPSVPTVGLPSCSCCWSLAPPLVEMAVVMPVGSS